MSKSHSPNAVVTAAAGVWKISEEVLRAGRANWVAEARFAVMGILRDQGMSMSEIGRAMGRDRGAVKHALRRAADMQGTDARFSARYAELLDALSPGETVPTDPLPSPPVGVVRLDYTDVRGVRCVFYGDAEAIAQHIHTHLFPITQ